jgi:hypothetical protein
MFCHILIFCCVAVPSECGPSERRCTDDDDDDDTGEWTKTGDIYKTDNPQESARNCDTG